MITPTGIIQEIQPQRNFIMTMRGRADIPASRQRVVLHYSTAKFIVIARCSAPKQFPCSNAQRYLSCDTDFFLKNIIHRVEPIVATRTTEFKCKLTVFPVDSRGGSSYNE